MSEHIETGKTGEKLAVEWLLKKGDQILEQNWRHSYYEIDIITLRKGVLCFIEVKTRKSLLYGYPEEAVTAGKIRRMMEAGAAYLDQHPDYIRVQYDILSIILHANGKSDFLLIEDLSC
jgi:putative endonuclease